MACSLQARGPLSRAAALWRQARGHQHAAAGHSHSHSHSHGPAAATPGMVEVCAMDPLLLLEPERLPAAEAAAASGGTAAYVPLQIPFRLLARLPAAHLVLADHDDPGNHWFFGERAELFSYKFVGRHRVESGFTSLVLASELAAVRAAPAERQNRKQAALADRSWLAFLQHVHGSSGEGLWPTPTLPFLFAGKAIDCASVGVYTLGDSSGSGGGLKGLCLSTEYETPGE